MDEYCRKNRKSVKGLWPTSLASMEAAGSNPDSGHCCGLCLIAGAPYTCPRCHLHFCSVRCYREHGSCAQDFQRRQLQLALQGQREDPASRRRLREALLRLHDLREPEDADLQLGLDPTVELWEQLSPEQRKAFQRLLTSGRISSLLPPWKPWWTGGSRGRALIQELEEPPKHIEPPKPPLLEEEREQPPKCPKSLHHLQSPMHLQENTSSAVEASNSAPPLPSSPIPPLDSLTRSPVSPLVRFQIPNALYSYAYSMSLYNGDTEELLPEFCETVLDVSGALGAKRVYSSTGEALQAALQAVTASRYPSCPLGNNTEVMVAVAQILMGECQAEQKGYSLAAFTHLSRLLSKGKRQVPTEDRSVMFMAQKKCEFLTAWVNENEAELTLLALEVQAEYKAHRDTVKELGAVTQEFEKMWGAKVPPPQKALIEELD